MECNVIKTYIFISFGSIYHYWSLGNIQKPSYIKGRVVQSNINDKNQRIYRHQNQLNPKFWLFPRDHNNKLNQTI